MKLKDRLPVNDNSDNNRKRHWSQSVRVHWVGGTTFCNREVAYVVPKVRRDWLALLYQGGSSRPHTTAARSCQHHDGIRYSVIGLQYSSAFSHTSTSTLATLIAYEGKYVLFVPCIGSERVQCGVVSGRVTESLLNEY